MYNLERAETEIKEQLAKKMPDNPVLNGWRSYSQCDEDGIIRECLDRIKKSGCPMTNTFIEFGCGNGLENNTAQLIIDGFHGCWIDGDNANIRYIEEKLGGTIFPSLWVREAFLDLGGVEAIIKDCAYFLGTKEVDLFSLDLDGNDSYLLGLVLRHTQPKLICLEYNAKFRPPTEINISYSKSCIWQNDDYFGASLQYFVNLLRKYDYSLICCNISGANAFFANEKFSNLFTCYPVEELYQPARYWLASGAPGHASSLKWVRQIVNERKTDETEKFRLIEKISLPAIQDEIVFGIGGNDSKYILGGFSVPEAGFRWTSGHNAVIAFSREENAMSNFDLICEITPLLFKRVRTCTHVRVFINGTDCGEWEITSPDVKITLHVDAALSENGRYIVEFKLPDAISPKDIGLNNDERKLALAFKKITARNILNDEI